MHVLVADDCELTRRIVARILVREGHCVVEAENGSEALQLAKEQSFDLVLLDVDMPKLTGLEVAQALRQLEGENFQGRTILGMTGWSADRDECIEAGMNACLGKPLSPGKLLACIEKLRQSEKTPAATQ